jgi:diguanylate cyclase (GGDEF)-like protein/PAS domain S-box-containing protein
MVNINSSIDTNFATSLMEDLVTPAFVLDSYGRVIIWNKACERLTGVSLNEVKGNKEHWKAFYNEKRPCLADLIVQERIGEVKNLYVGTINIEANDHGIHAENWCVMPKAGKELYLAIDAGPIYDQHGNLTAVVETLRDITAYKKAMLNLENLALVDGLTGVINRRAFDDKLLNEWLRCCRDKTALALAILDIDYFKLYNDGYGHQAGDECLKLVAKTITKAVYRPADSVARYGGEEFVIIMPSTTIDAAVIVAERVRQSVLELNIQNVKSKNQAVTLSIGVSSVTPLKEMKPNLLLTQADEALYQAKASGRNRVVPWESSTTINL